MDAQTFIAGMSALGVGLGGTIVAVARIWASVARKRADATLKDRAAKLEAERAAKRAEKAAEAAEDAAERSGRYEAAQVPAGAPACSTCPVHEAFKVRIESLEAGHRDHELRVRELERAPRGPIYGGAAARRT
jgi:hypothetical protein